MADIYAVVEGPTERAFVQNVIAPHLAPSGLYLYAAILRKKGQNGGDVRFVRARRDIGGFLKQRRDTWVTTLVDFYGIGDDWPGYEESKCATVHELKAKIMNNATHAEINKEFGEHDSERRFLPYVSMHETEALLFSEPDVLAQELGTPIACIRDILDCCGSPEQINDSFATTPSRRLKALAPRFKKTSTGIAIAKKIGVDQIRAKCPIFDDWISRIESLPN